jgi:hypothetical protein
MKISEINDLPIPIALCESCGEDSCCDACEDSDRNCTKCPIQEVFAKLYTYENSNISKEEFIARIRHMGWICYQMGANQPYNIEPNKDQLDSLINGVKYALDNPNMTPEQNHKNWMKCKIEQGWVYGEVKDFEKKTHPDIVPFDELPKVEKDKDIMDKLITKEAERLFNMLYKEN